MFKNYNWRKRGEILLTGPDNKPINKPFCNLHLQKDWDQSKSQELEQRDQVLSTSMSP